MAEAMACTSVGSTKLGRVAGDFGQGGRVGGDDGAAAGHGFEGRVAEGFGEGDVDEGVGLPVEGTDAVVGDRAEELDGVAYAQFLGHATQVCGGEIGVGAGDVQFVRNRVASAQRGEGLQEAWIVLVAVEGGDGEQVGTLRLACR